MPREAEHSRLLRAMLEPSVQRAGNTITLPEGTFWPDLYSEVLYVRYFYDALWNDVLKRGLSEKIHGAIILGTPGSEWRASARSAGANATCVAALRAQLPSRHSACAFSFGR